MAHVSSEFHQASLSDSKFNGFKDVWETWFPEVKEQYRVLMEYLQDKYNLAPAYQLGPTYPALPFMASTLNLGPQTVTLPHYDGKNLATGLCGVMPFGPFDSARGGHLCLHEAGVVLEMAPGQVALIPSAVIQHSNFPVLEGEKRYSITTYTAGHLFAWRENNGSICNLSPNAKKAYESKGPRRWEKGWGLFPRVLGSSIC